MQFNDLWNIIEQKNQQLVSGKITMSSESFKKAMQLAFDQGVVEQKKFSSLKDSLCSDGSDFFWRYFW